jgi:hypothetical protein
VTINPAGHHLKTRQGAPDGVATTTAAPAWKEQELELSEPGAFEACPLPLAASENLQQAGACVLLKFVVSF